jgi:hypothetical protein
MAIADIIGSVLLLYISYLPLLLAGFAYGLKPLKLSLVASMVCAFLFLAQGALAYGVLIALPSFLLLWFAHQQHNDAWLPMGNVLEHLTCYILAIILVLVTYMGGTEAITSMIAGDMEAQFADPESEFAKTIMTMLNDYGFFFFAATAWGWLLMLYLMAYIADSIVDMRGGDVRSLALTPFNPTRLTLFGLLIAGAMTFLDDPEWLSVGKIITLMLLLPYTLSGIAQMHVSSKNWPLRTLWLAFIYFMTITSLWPIAVFAIIGVIYHCKVIGKKQQNV